MSDDLTRLVPTAGRLHRDDLLFAAGRASAPSPKWWRRACGLLLAANALLLWRAGGVSPLLPRTAPRSEVEENRGLTPPARPDDSEPPPPSSYIALLRGSPVEPPATAAREPSGPPLTAGSIRLPD